MALIVEDGSIVPNADSFVSLADARVKADALGLVLSTDDTKADQTLRNGARYVCSLEPSLQGSRVSADQSLCYPRTGVTRHGYEVADDAIPDEVICAQIEAAAAIEGGTDPYPVDEGKEIASEEVTGAVKVSYFEGGKTDSNVTITSATNCLYPLTLRAIGRGGKFTVTVNRG
jgi:hypothetical protein